MERNRLLALAYEQSTDALLLIENGVIIDCNTSCATLLGYESQADIIGLRPSDLSPQYQPDGSESTVREVEMIGQALITGSACFEWMHQRADGHLMPVEVLLTAIECEGQRIVHANWRDISQRRQTENALAYRRALESLVTRISGYFINLPAESVDDGVEQALADLGAFVDADRSYIFIYQDDLMNNPYEWCAPGVAPQIARMQGVPIASLAWFNDLILSGRILNTTRIADLPAVAQAEKEEFSFQGTQSLLVVPMERRGQVVGFIGYDAVRAERHWPDEIVDLLRIAAGIIANVLDRRDAELELRETNASLEMRVQERTRALEKQHEIADSLRETLAIVNSSLSLKETLDHLAQQARDLTGATACALYSVDQSAGTARIEGSVGILEDLPPEDRTFSLDTTPGQELLLVLDQREPVAINYDAARLEQMLNDPNLTDVIRTQRIKLSKQFSASLAVALGSHGTAFGALVLHYDKQQDFSEHQLTTAMTLAEQASLAIENARLHEAEQERRVESEQRRRIAEGLRDGLTILNSDRTPDEILDFIIQQAVALLGSGGGALYLLDEEHAMLRVGASQGLDESYTALPLPAGGAITGRAVALGEAVSIPDISAGAELLNSYLSEPNIPAGWTAGLAQLKKRYNAILSVPMKTGDRVYGAITLYYAQPQRFSDDVIRLADAFAGQAALVIENARLRERVRLAAAVEERSRLARDLHDAVTQTLFSASLIADTLPDLWRIDQGGALDQLSRLGQLTRGALAEMRTLLIELRPARLVEGDIATLLRQLVDAAGGRSQVDIQLQVQSEHELPPDVKIVCYRVVQEALNNIVKHAQARQAFISLRCNESGMTLQVLDDGSGFDPAAVGPGHFGLQIMNERAQAVGAALIIDTQPGEGTEIQLTWRKDE